MSKREVKYISLDDIAEAEVNPKRHAKEVIQKSVSRFGFTEPMMIDDRTGKLVAGHGRLNELKRMKKNGEVPPDGVTEKWEAPVITGWASKSDDEARAYVVASNRTTELGGWDNQELFDVLNSLDDLDGLGYVLEDLDDLAIALSAEKEIAPVVGDADINEEVDQNFRVVVSFENESDQASFIERMLEEGFKCQALM